MLAPNFQLRESRQARRIRLELTAAGELVVVVPVGLADGERIAAELVARNQIWIARARQRLAQRLQEHGTALAPVALPERLELRALGTSWRVDLRPVTMPPGRIHLYREGQAGPTPCLALAHAATAPPPLETVLATLRNWLRAQAEATLPKWLHDVAAECGLAPPATVRLSFQRTRWGSCARSGCISLNIKLLFLPPALVRHVMIHELCHFRHMDHGTRFQRLLQEHDPEATALRQELRRANTLVPPWCEGS